METSLPASQAASAPSEISRDNLGRFVKGVSGNPKGKPIGSRNRINIIKHAIEEAIIRDVAEEATLIIEQALMQAKAGDPDMIKFVLGELLKDVRKGAPDEDEDLLRGGKRVTVNITQYFGDEGGAQNNDALEGDFTPVESVK
jgi:hypothetical protein